MKTFEEDLKPEITPEFIEKCVELAEGFTWNSKSFYDPFDNLYYIEDDIKSIESFPLLLHRAVEGFIKQYDGVEITNSHVRAGLKIFYYSDYQPCHLTACEMAILDCLKEVLK